MQPRKMPTEAEEIFEMKKNEFCALGEDVNGKRKTESDKEWRNTEQKKTGKHTLMSF